jgi:beta-exotoxin I transport system permease protein
MNAVLVPAIRRRRVGLLGWSLGLVALVTLVAVSYPAVRGNTELDRTFAQMSPAVRSLLGLGAGAALTSPAGYLNSQFFANLLPVMLLIFGIGGGAWAIAGDEAAGMLELLLANPVSRPHVAVARFTAVAVMICGLAVVTLAALLAAREPAGLGQVTPMHLTAAVAATAAMALVYSALAFAVGAGGGARATALATAGGAAVVGFVLEGLGQAVAALRPLRDLMPWHWLLAADPLVHGASWRALGLPLAVTVVLCAAGTVAFVRRDLR